MPDCSDNNKSIGGIDTDNDGVRDDIQRYIAAIDFDHEFFKRGLMEWAKVFRTGVMESNQPEQSQINFTRMNLAADCFWSAQIDKKYQYSRVINKLTTNTFKRRFANYRWMSSLKSQLVPSANTAEEACSFQVSDFSGERLR